MLHILLYIYFKWQHLHCDLWSVYTLSVACGFNGFVSPGCVFHSYVSLCDHSDPADQRCNTRGS